MCYDHQVEATKDPEVPGPESNPLVALVQVLVNWVSM